MSSKTTLSITEARKQLFKIAKEVQKPDTQYILTENGKPKVIIMSVEEFESWKETIEVMYHFPNLKKDIEEAEKEYEKGEYITLEELLEEEGYAIKNNKLKKKNVSNRPKKKSTKKPK